MKSVRSAVLTCINHPLRSLKRHAVSDALFATARLRGSKRAIVTFYYLSPLTEDSVVQKFLRQS